jgi:hypothetical protein
MYEADDRSENGLEEETLRRMRDVFGGRVCSACGAAASWLCGGEFFCHDHYPRVRKAIRAPRMYHCPAPVGA